jgi:hypothetical protein
MLAVERRRLIATLFALLLGACGGNSESDGDEDGDDSSCEQDDECPEGRVCADVDGNQNDTCESGERCECAVVAPGTGGAGGTGGTTTNGGTGGGAGNPSCVDDRQCQGGRLCIDIDGDGDGFCEVGETCECVSVGDTGGGGSTGVGGTSSGGSTSTGGSAGRGGGGSGGAPATGLGAPCSADTDCGGAPLVCLLSNGLPDRSGPPGGLCTLPCTSDDECLEHASNAYCVGFANTTDGLVSYCVEGCDVGPTSAPKCDLRADFACGILDTIPATALCSTTDDCPGGQICLEDVCQDVVSACVPTCGGSFDCASDQFCNFATGFCVPTAPGGSPIGALCDPQLPPEQDECNGFCLDTDGTGTQGTCAAFCSANPSVVGCGWDGQGAAEAGCLFATVISRDNTGSITLSQSDLMLCGALCDCNADCPATSDRCVDENSANATASILALFGRLGYCRPLQATETEADTFAVCP